MSDAGVVSTGVGYHVCLDHLARVLDGGDVPPVVSTDARSLELRYAEAFGLPAPAERHAG